MCLTQGKQQKAVTHDGSSYSDHYEVHAIHMENYARGENEPEKRKWLDFLIGDQVVKQTLATNNPLLDRLLQALIELNQDEVTRSEATEYHSSLQKVYLR
ncbi:hypothetical protein [Psychrobacillus sp. OK032]|uniref:hypothetical protein n=1 Tax=Psychrobacillus sp. OK032 TaxID=1884358 RepID=UPI000B885316|nr:hypothetical protein [Psychrobacillus sp. OK032]